MDDKKTIVFYSYKGGSGRTLALANVASYLARFNFKVCIIDMDLEAPGVHYKFFRDASQKIKNTLGVVDYIDYYLRKELPPPDIAPYLLNVNENISIMPSGDVTSDDYWYKLSKINWHELLYEEDSSGLRLLFDLLGRLQNSIGQGMEFDYILIDARAGLTPLSGLCASIFGDVLVTFFTASVESIDGTKQMLKLIQETRNKDDLPSIPIITVLTRYEKYSNLDEEDSFITDKKSALLGIENTRDNFCVIHADRDIERRERIIFDMQSTPDESGADYDKPIQLDYLQLFSLLFNDEIMKDRASILLKSITNIYSLINEPDKVQKEYETIASVYPHPTVLKELIKIYLLRSIDTLDNNKFSSALERYYRAGGSDILDDDFYLKSFINNYSHPYYIHNKQIQYDLEKIYTKAKTMDKQTKLIIANIFRDNFFHEQYQKAFELYKDLLPHSEYNSIALENIMKLFLLYEDLFRNNINLLPDLNDSRLSNILFLELQKAVFNVYIKYYKFEKADEFLVNQNFINYLLEDNPIALIEICMHQADYSNLYYFAEWIIKTCISSHDEEKLYIFLNYFYANQQMFYIDDALPKNDPIVHKVFERLQGNL